MSARAYWVNVLVAFIFIIPIASIYEGLYLYRQWRITYYEAEQLKKENLQSQLDSLKAQISPHFLFNSLSTLSSLVSEDPKRAEWFIEELASVYRYLLQNNEQPLTTLENELRFIQAYFHLLQTRFGKGIELELQVDERYYSFLLPPLTLQLLLENAVKHNAVTVNRPLIIRVFTDEVNNLYVLNTVRKKNHTVPSDGTGLQNIRKKFRLLKQPDPTINQTDDCFQVMLPLLKSASYEFLNY
jgi:LytS/YehU family sensor histidine kinase